MAVSATMSSDYLRISWLDKLLTALFTWFVVFCLLFTLLPKASDTANQLLTYSLSKAGRSALINNHKETHNHSAPDRASKNSEENKSKEDSESSLKHRLNALSLLAAKSSRLPDLFKTCGSLSAHLVWNLMGSFYHSNKVVLSCSDISPPAFLI